MSSAIDKKNAIDVAIQGTFTPTNNSITSGDDVKIALQKTQGQLNNKLTTVANLGDVANRQTALNNLTNVSSAINEYVLTKDTATGNASWKASQGGGGGSTYDATFEYAVADMSGWKTLHSNLGDVLLSATGEMILFD